jgi:hypothetical protein
MKIMIDPGVFIRLQTIGIAYRQEFSGFGFATREGKGEEALIRMYDFVLLDLGSEVYTQIKPDQVLELQSREDIKNMRVWCHAHPMGDGIPGIHNWSGTDNATIEKEPLGCLPELLGWSASIVRTPRGWVGRVDNHIAKKTLHCPVEPETRSVYEEVAALRDRKFGAPFASSLPASEWDERWIPDEPALTLAEVADAYAVEPEEVIRWICQGSLTEDDLVRDLAVEPRTAQDFLTGIQRERALLGANQLPLFAPNQPFSAGELYRLLRARKAGPATFLQRIRGLWR